MSQPTVSAAVAMIERDRASAALGMQVTRSLPGDAVVTMRIRDDMLNGFEVTHGGIVFALADTAFAIACNEDEQITLAAGADITFLKPTHGRADAHRDRERRARSGRTGLYDVSVTDENGEIVAEFRGRSHTTSRQR